MNGQLLSDAPKRPRKAQANMNPGTPTIVGRPRLNNFVCWTRMQAEAGEPIHDIVYRKELERRAGRGIFFWGVGNAPNRSIPTFAKEGEDVDVVFSLMKSRPKACDASPKEVIVWNTYFDSRNSERPLPRHVLITSRGSFAREKRAHYALICSSKQPLYLADYGTFDPGAYRNISDARGRIAPSQVTALVSRECPESQSTDYQINLHAKLARSYWVRLGSPVVLRKPAISSIPSFVEGGRRLNLKSWLQAVAYVRTGIRSRASAQLHFFDADPNSK